MKTIAIFTTTRADLGIFSALVEKLTNSNDLDVKIFAGGTHFSKKHGHTIDELKELGFKITDTFDFLKSITDSYSLAKAMGKETLQLADIFKHHTFEYVCVLGDRYELLPIVQTAILFYKPIIHLHGGERTEGVIDEQIRHMISKAAHIHFTSCEEYAQNLRKMGEQSWRICNTGSLMVDQIVKRKSITKTDLFYMLGLDTKKLTVLLTYHPETLERNISVTTQIENIFHALEDFNLQIIITAPNIEDKSTEIINAIEEYVVEGDDRYFFPSLGSFKYLNLLPYCEFVIGNSSSGLIEVPFFKIPTINIGDRQKGRIRHKSVIDTSHSIDNIRTGIKKALNPEFRASLINMIYKFGNGNAADKIINFIKDIEIDSRLMRKELNFAENE